MRYVGRALPRLEDPPLLRGEGQFTDDIVRDGQVYAAFVRSPHAHARLAGIDQAAARHASGVLAILTGGDYLADAGRGISHVPVPADAVHHERPAFGGAFDQPHLPLAVEVVRYVGEAVAVVIAETAAQARDAALLVDVDYQPLPAVVDVLQALAPGAAQLWPGAPGNVAADATFGDTDATTTALASCAVIIEHDFRNQRIANAQLEPRAALAEYLADSDAYVLTAGSQGVHRQRAALAGALGEPVERVRVISPDVGGGFGARTSLYPEQVVVAWAARRVGRPVRWSSDRSEAFLTDFQGRDSFARARLGLDEDGRMRALSLDFLLNVGAHTVSYVPLNNAARILTSVYDIPTACARARALLTNTVPTGPYRGAGRPEAMFVLERLLDIAARELGIDRIELRRRNLVNRTSLPYRSAMGLTYDSGDFRDAMEQALARSDWATFAERRRAARERGRLAGIGLANYVEAPVGAPHERVHLSVLPEGVVDLAVGTQSTGQGHATSYAQVVADELGIAPAQVRLVTGDTQRVASGGGTHSDRSMRLVGTLLVEACAKLRDLASEMSGLQPEEIDLFDLARRTPISADAVFTGRLPAYPTGTAVCELEIDAETGQIEVTRYTSVDDVGQPINPLILHGQTHGGIVQGVGQALTEQVVFDQQSGQPLSASFADYALLGAAAVPAFDVTLVEDPTQGNPLRIKGGGESGITPSLAAVVNAAVDAMAGVGITHLEMPLTPFRMWQALTKAPPELG